MNNFVAFVDSFKTPSVEALRKERMRQDRLVILRELGFVPGGACLYKGEVCQILGSTNYRDHLSDIPVIRIKTTVAVEDVLCSHLETAETLESSFEDPEYEKGDNDEKVFNKEQKEYLVAVGRLFRTGVLKWATPNPS